MDSLTRIVFRILTLLGLSFVFGIGFLFAFKMDNIRELNLKEITFWHAQIIAFSILLFNLLIDLALTKICYRKKYKKNDSK